MPNWLMCILVFAAYHVGIEIGAYKEQSYDFNPIWNFILSSLGSVAFVLGFSALMQ